MIIGLILGFVAGSLGTAFALALVAGTAPDRHRPSDDDWPADLRDGDLS